MTKEHWNIKTEAWYQIMIIYGALYFIPFLFGMFGLSGLFGWFTSVWLEHIASNLMIASALGGAYLLF